jgi:hypothetical protein
MGWRKPFFLAPQKQVFLLHDAHCAAENRLAAY